MGIKNKIINWINKKTSCVRYKAKIEYPLKDMENGEKFYFLKHRYQHGSRKTLKEIVAIAYTVTDRPLVMNDTYNFLGTRLNMDVNRELFCIPKKEGRSSCVILKDIFDTTIISTSLKPLYQYINETYRQIKKDLLVDNKTIFFRVNDGTYEVYKKYTPEMLENDRIQIMIRINSLPTFK